MIVAFLPRNKVAWSMIAFVVAILAMAGGILLHSTRFSPDVSYLPADGRAAWILYPHHRGPMANSRFPMRTEFRKKFAVSHSSGPVTLALRAMRSATVWINGRAIPRGSDDVPNWKHFEQWDVGELLQPGENEITVTVMNSEGPPALWLAIAGKAWSVATDGSWEASLVGATWLPARRADEAITQADLFFRPDSPSASPAASLRETTANPPSGFETTYHSVWNRKGTLLVLLLAGALIWLAGEYLFHRRPKSSSESRSPPTPPRNSSSSTGGRRRPDAAMPLATGPEGNCPKVSNRAWIALFALTALGWIALTAHNATVLPGPLGFDYPGHVEYIDYLLKKHWLPLPVDGWQMYQPPLYYLITAIPLEVFRLEPTRPPGLHWIRAVQCFIVLAQLAIVLFSLRLMFPEDARRQWGGYLIAAYPPALAYLSQYVTNELLTATMASAAVFTALWIFRQPSAPTRAHVLLGIWLGLGLLSKVTALIVAVVVLAILVGRLAVARTWSIRAWGGTVGVTLLTMLLVCGWHYGRIRYHYGDWVVGNWDTRTGFSWWQDPGYHSASYYLRFGKSLTQPIYVGMDSFWDTVYVTLWGDGMCASGAEPRYRTPWNYDLMAAGFLLALVPTAMILVGTTAAVIDFLKRPTSAGFLIVGLLFSCGFSLVLATLRLPYYGQAKAFYVLSAWLPLCLVGGWGFDVLARHSRWIQRLLGTLLVAWNLNTYATYWVDGDSPTTRESTSHHLALVGRNADAEEQLASALRLDPRYPPAIVVTASNLASEPGRLHEAMLLYRRALALDPQSPDARAGIGSIHRKLGDLRQARIEYEKAVSVNPNLYPTWMELGDVHLSLGELDGAEVAFREALRVRPGSGTAHQRLAAIHDRLGNAAKALEYGNHAVALLPGEPVPTREQAARLAVNGRYSEAVELLKTSVAKNPASILLKIELAWILATCPEDSIRDGKEAVRLAEQAQSALPEGETGALDALAAAYAETGNHAEAAKWAEKLASAMTKPEQREQRQEVENRVRLYRQKKPYRESPTTSKP